MKSKFFSKSRKYIFGGLVCANIVLVAQDHQFQNFNASQLQINPSFAGSNEGFRNRLSYRMQWPDLSGNSVSYYNSADLYIKSFNCGIGLNLFNEDQVRGTLKESRIEAVYAQHFKIGHHYKLIPSAQFSYCLKRLDLTKLNYGDVIDQRRNVVWNNPGSIPVFEKTFYDVAAGLLLSTDKLFAGVSVYHLNRPSDLNYGDSRLPLRYNAYASYNYFIHEKHILQMTMIGFHQETFTLLRIHTNLLYNNRWIIGSGYSGQSQLIANAGYRRAFYSINFIYDKNLSKKNGNTASSYEINLSFNLIKKEHRGELRAFERF